MAEVGEGRAVLGGARGERVARVGWAPDGGRTFQFFNERAGGVSIEVTGRRKVSTTMVRRKGSASQREWLHGDMLAGQVKEYREGLDVGFGGWAPTVGR